MNHVEFGMLDVIEINTSIPPKGQLSLLKEIAGLIMSY
jgi:hypothetical protein